jgi:GntR family carbon starvation induced transcriptional regulator
MNLSGQELNLFGEAAKQGNSDTLSERAASLVERDILAGVFRPGDRLGVVALSGRYSIGATPLREGLSRLVSRGLISSIGQKGFRVTPLSKADLIDITEVRVLVETEALGRSMRDGGDGWEANVLSALHRLSRLVEREPDTIREGTPEFDRLHKAFHRSLLEACGSERLLKMHDELYDQAYRYRRAMMGLIAAHDDFVAGHRRLVEVALRRDAAAQRELATHLRQTVKFVYGD